MRKSSIMADSAGSVKIFWVILNSRKSTRYFDLNIIINMIDIIIIYFIDFIIPPSNNFDKLTI